MSFTLHPDLARDCFEVTDLPLSKLLVRNDSRFPWIILVPRRASVSEWFDLKPGDSEQFHKEAFTLAERMKKALGADKMNVAALGNMTPQLHVHVIARFKTDPAWPAPVWSKGRAKPYSAPEKTALVQKILSII